MKCIQKLGYFYHNGYGVKRNDKESLKWFKKSAKQDDEDAQQWIGWFYEKGLGGLSVDNKTALKWYRKAAKNGGG